MTDDAVLCTALRDLRKSLLADPYFRHVPSMQTTAGRTATFFLAKDDLPEVRREVFHLLLKHDVKFLEVVRNKESLYSEVIKKNSRNPFYRYNPNELYDQLVSRLFKDLLHKEESYIVHFAMRGKSPRTEALREALSKAQRRFEKKWGISSNAPVEIRPCHPQQEECLQAADYFLWALQRLYERH